MAESVDVAVRAEHAGWRCEQRLAEALDGLSRKDAIALLRRRCVRLVDGDRVRLARKGERLVPGQRLQVAVADLEPKPDPLLPLDVVFESADLIVINKPAGVPSVPVGIGELGSIANACLARYPEMQGVGYRRREPGLCHRLDTHTSGLLLAARNRRSFDLLQRAIQTGAIEKRYIAICHDHGLADCGSVDRALRHRPKAVEVVAAKVGNSTRYKVLKRHQGLALVEVQAAAAFRHQVRAHMAWLGAPLLGDTLYGAPEHPLGHHALHASQLAWRSAELALAFRCEAPLPAALSRLVEPPTDLGA